MYKYVYIYIIYVSTIDLGKVKKTVHIWEIFLI